MTGKFGFGASGGSPPQTREIPLTRGAAVTRISSSEAARRIGVATNTLARWRCQGKGPAGAVRLSATHTVYPLDAVEHFIQEKAAASRFLGTPKSISRAAAVACAG